MTSPITWTTTTRAFAAIALALLAGATCAPALAQSPVTLKMHHFLGPKSSTHANMLEPWARRVEAMSKGRLKIEIYPSMSLGGKPPDLIKQVRDGVVDIVWTVNGYTPALFPRSEVFELPFVHTNDIAATNLALKAMFDKHLAPEYRGTKVLWLHVHAGQGLQMADTEVRKPEDLQGKRIRIPSRTGAWLLEALGASPVGMPVPDLPQSLSKKIVDGALVPFEIIPALKLHELTKFQIEGNGNLRFGTIVFQAAMNEARFKSLPADLQQVLVDASGDAWLRELGQIWTRSEEVGLDLVRKAGGKHVVLSDAEMAAFREKLEPVVARWIAEVAKRGIDGKALVETARATIAKHKTP